MHVVRNCEAGLDHGTFPMSDRFAMMDMVYSDHK